MRPFALIGFVAALQTAHGDPAGEAEGSSMLQVNMNKPKGFADCDAAKHFCYDAIDLVQNCMEKYTSEGTQSICSRAVCSKRSVDDSEDVRNEDAPVLRAMCKRAARSSKWGHHGLTCPLPGESGPYEQFCNNLDEICDAWAFNLVRVAHEKTEYKENLCNYQFVSYNKATFEEENGGPGCFDHGHNFTNYLPGLPSVTEYMAQQSSFMWSWVDDTAERCRDAHQMYTRCTANACTKDVCLHLCERERDQGCRGVVFEPKKSDGAGVCHLKKAPCYSNNKEALQLDRGAGLVQTGNASTNKVSEETEPVLAELARRALKVGSSDDVINRHLESTMLSKCSDPC